jgi:hypothetical protein
MLNAVELNQFVVRFGLSEPSEATDQTTKAVISRVQTDGVGFVSERLGRICGRRAFNGQLLRVQVGGWRDAERPPEHRGVGAGTVIAMLQRDLQHRHARRETWQA